MSMPVRICERDNWTCQLCGIATPRELRGSVHPHAPEVDHIVPRSRGGSNDDSNLRCTCRSCNYKKQGFLDHEPHLLPKYPVDILDTLIIEEAKRNSITGSRKAGLKNAAKPGYFSRIGKIGGREGGKTTAKTWAGQKEHLRKLGKIHGGEGGKTTAKTWAGQKEHLRKLGSFYGKAAAPIARHTRWHSRRGIFNPACDLCLREYAFRSDFLC